MKKNVQIAAIVVGCVLLNYLGKWMAEVAILPVWFDAFGTVIAAYLLGPVCGAMVGATLNIVYGMQNPVALIYGITSIAIGISVGILSKKRFLDQFFGVLSASVAVTMVSTIISTPINILFYEGYTGNLWGDGVIGFLSEHGLPKIFCYIAGEFYIDFVDKTMMLLIVYAMKRVWDVTRGDKDGKIVLPLLLCGLLVSSPMEAKAESYNEYISSVQTVYNRENGLPCGEANDIVQTNDGILWIGTYAGLYRYNGSEFRWMDEYDSVKNVNCMYVDEEGRLWVGTNDNGLSVIINETVANVVDSGDGLPSDSVRSIVQSYDGSYYVGTASSMQIIALSGGLKVQEEIEEVKFADSLAADENGYVVAVTSAGELFVIKDRKVVKKATYEEGKGQFMCAAFDEYGILHVGTSEGKVVTYRLENDRLKMLQQIDCGRLHTINRLYFSDKKQLFVCADNGVGYFNAKDKLFEINTGSFNNAIDHALVDYQGNVWFTSYRLGLLRICQSDFTNHYTVAGLESKVANSSCEWNGLLYVGTDSGLDIIDIQNHVAKENDLTEALAGVRIRCVTVDSKNHLWICTYGMGLWEIDGEDIRKYDQENGEFGNRTRLIRELSDGSMAISDDKGVTVIKDGEVQYSVHYGEGIGNASILSIMEWNPGELILGSDGDGICILKKGQIYRKLTKSSGLGSGVILRTVKDELGDGVFVIASNGLYYMNKNYQIEELSNFPYYNNYDLWETKDGKLFVLGSAGVYVVDRASLLAGQEVEYVVLNARSGLDSSLTANSWNYMDAAGNLYLSCDSGVYSMNVARYGSKTKSYRMLVSGMKFDDDYYSVERGTPVEIGREVNKIEIYPEVINYTLENPYVSYYMEGFDLTPTTTLQSDLTSIVYTNLPSGQYTFHLRVLEGRTGKVLEESTYSIEKEMEIYDNGWFMGYMLVVFILVVAWFTWFIVRTQIQRTIMLQRKELELARAQVEMGNQAILTIAKTVDAKDGRTSQHSQRVSEYSVLIAEELGMSEEDCENLRKTALLHDIGKIGIPDSILNKPEGLTDDEYKIMKTHVTNGATILKDFTMLDHVWEGALYHHERYDGTGYYEGLKGEEIPLNARIVGIADAFDAMTANRVYRKKMDVDVVLGILEGGKGTQFDPALVDIMLKLIKDGKINIEAIYQRQEE